MGLNEWFCFPIFVEGYRKTSGLGWTGFSLEFEVISEGALSKLRDCCNFECMKVLDSSYATDCCPAWAGKLKMMQWLLEKKNVHAPYRALVVLGNMISLVSKCLAEFIISLV